MSDLAPVVMFVYDRLEQTKKSIHALQNNYLAKETSLYIYSDGAKNSNSTEDVMKVREFINNIIGFKKISITERANNFGLADSLIDGITTVVNEYGKLIVLEDDLITSRYFLNYMNDALNIYEDSLQVGSISGYAYPLKNMPKSYFINKIESWGWGTWKDRWELFEPNGKILLKELFEKKQLKRVNFNNSFKYSDMLKQQVNKENDSWAIRWYISLFLKENLTLYPGKTFVQNIGFGDDGTHTKVGGEVYHKGLNNLEEPLEKIEVSECMDSRKKIENFYFSLKLNFLQRIKRKIRNFIR